MKKLLTLTTLMLGTLLCAQAQDKKTWDFTKGLSPETVANLDADANWTANSQDANGNNNVWQNVVKPSTTIPLQANGETIKETDGLLIDIKSNAGNSIHIAQNRIRLTRANTTITFPQLRNGQKVTIVGRSANGTATDRGIRPSYSYLQLTDGTTTNDQCIFLGNQVEGSLGTYSFTWEVVTDETGPVDVQFTLAPSAGIDFTLFMIDDGDAPVTTSIAYLFDGNDDLVLSTLQSREETTVTPINLTSESITAEALQDYDVTVIGANVPTDAATAALLKDALPWTPVLNLNAGLYPVWGYGEAIETETLFARITNRNHAIFAGLTDDDIIVEDDITAIPLAQGWSGQTTGVRLGDYFDGDNIMAVDIEGEMTLIHAHNPNHNGYILLPYVSDYSASALKLIDNAVGLLAASKREITPATAPRMALQYKDRNTNVVITPPSLPKAKVFYTLDGSQPTTASTLYDGPVNVTEETVVKAVAIAEGYTVSDVAEITADIKSQPKTPVITWVEEEGRSIITITCETEDADVFYNFTNTTDTVASSKYVGEPVIITMPQTVTAFAVAGQVVFSEVATQRVLVRNPRVVIDVAAHYSAPQWTADNNPEGLAVSNGRGMFAWGQTAESMWEGEGTTETVVDPDTGDETEVTTHNPEDLRPLTTVNEPGDDPQWMITSRGEAVIWQNNGFDNNDIGNNEGGYHPSVAEDVDPLFPVSRNDIQFYRVYAGEQPNGAIQSIRRYQAPLDIVTLANMQAGTLEAQVSADGEKWTTVGEPILATGYSRMWKKYTNSYDGTDEVYVRVAHVDGGGGAKVADIYVANAGEESQRLLDELNQEYNSGIGEVSSSPSVARSAVYDLQGRPLGMPRHGLNIIADGDGSVRKVFVK